MKSVTLDVYTQKTVTVNNPVTEMVMTKQERNLIYKLLSTIANLDARGDAYIKARNEYEFRGDEHKSVVINSAWAKPEGHWVLSEEISTAREMLKELR